MMTVFIWTPPHFDSWRSGGRSDLTPERAARGTFDWLTKEYKETMKFTRLSRSQRTNHEHGFSLVAEHRLKDSRRFGSLPLALITASAVDRLYEKLVDADGRNRITTINHAMKSCRRAWNVMQRAEPKGVPPLKPFSRVGLKDVSRETPTATYDELLAVVAAADEAGRGSLGTAAMVTWEWLQREEHVFGALLAGHYRPKNRPNAVLVLHPKTGEAIWLPLLDHAGAALFPELCARLDALKRDRTGGPMIVRDCGTEPSFVRAAGIRDELTFTSFRHGGMTELGRCRPHRRADSRDQPPQGRENATSRYVKRT